MTQPGPRYRQLPLWRDASRFLLEVETAVRQFPRDHKYTLGSELRGQAMTLCRLVARAAHAGDPVQRAALVERLGVSRRPTLGLDGGRIAAIHKCLGYCVRMSGRARPTPTIRTMRGT